VVEDAGEQGLLVHVVDVRGAASPDETVSDTAHPVAVRRVELLGQGAGLAGVKGVRPGEWVVTVGQHLLGRDADATARVRRASWERVIELQALQREDILRGFLEKQQRMAKTLGAKPPTTEEVRRAARESPQ
jgi:hypothetical protein